MLDVLLIDTGERYRCSPDESLLAGMERLGRHGIPVGCRGGGCGVCKVRVLDGAYRTLKMSAAHISAEERATHIVLACRALPEGNLSIRVEGRMRKSILKFVPNKTKSLEQENI